jgi:hypothetical protein
MMRKTKRRLTKKRSKTCSRRRVLVNKKGRTRCGRTKGPDAGGVMWDVLRAGHIGNNESPKRFQCCVCKKMSDKDHVFETTRCKIKGPYYRHKICSDCWWGTDDKPGFANEESVHECPGCKQHIEPIRRPATKPVFLDLTGDDDDA